MAVVTSVSLTNLYILQTMLTNCTNDALPNKQVKIGAIVSFIICLSVCYLETQRLKNTHKCN
jgi:hypothetical protein